MRIYKPTKTNSFLTLDLKNERASTRSSYPEIFYDNLKKGNYSYFSFQQVGVKSVNKKEIIFKTKNYDEYNGGEYFKSSEIYKYIGDADDKESLINLLKKVEK